MSAKKKGKKPRLGATPSPSKEPRTVPLSVTNQRPHWRFRDLDTGGPWCWTKMDGASCHLALDKLSAFETMTWAEIEGANHHFLNPESLSKGATKRLAEIQKDEHQDRLFSLRLKGRARVIGIKYDACLHLLWWDPDHEVAPSKKKHT